MYNNDHKSQWQVGILFAFAIGFVFFGKESQINEKVQLL